MYITKTGTPIQGTYKNYKYELPNNEYKWIPDDWYETRATKAEQNLVDLYVEAIYNAVKYVTDKDTRLRIIMKLTPISEMPCSEFRHQIIDRFYKTISQRKA